MANIGTEHEIVVIPEPMTIPDTVPEERPAIEPAKVPVPA